MAAIVKSELVALCVKENVIALAELKVVGGRHKLFDVACP